ncbi:hypothetical protein BCV39_13930 [Vibrio sp. 10N.286.55.E10]|uniref:hypothetical protein n=1 Tax=unclassified Vibrio TaxID=2614977 RepID=UPI000C845946|nr:MULTISPECIES: hypothetical protein [unclassified Vibrio]PME25910.1 hypothetical protein BCV40_18345 [Vibrio sp. 10N.286.55.E12]PME37241.1 hypothetical protein BCV39_13930 [Vibrio sp. 10N.286.55.E10]PME62667.1 hypothetical protein BCV32_21875 [Vibrio sp. 10N.286.55.C11]
MFNFNEKLLEGAQARDQAVEYKKQVSDVYKELAVNISTFLGFDVNFYEGDEYESTDSGVGSKYAATAAGIAAAALSINGLGLNNRKKTGYKLVSLSTKNRELKTGTLFKTIEPDSGYPITITHKKSERFCYNQSELVEALSDLVSTVFFHDELQKLKKKD